MVSCMRYIRYPRLFIGLEVFAQSILLRHRRVLWVSPLGCVPNPFSPD
jgi:hypothetical protein